MIWWNCGLLCLVIRIFDLLAEEEREDLFLGSVVDFLFLVLGRCMLEREQRLSEKWNARIVFVYCENLFHMKN